MTTIQTPKSSNSRSWRSLGRIALFYISCIVALIATSSVAPAGQGVMAVLLTGTLAGLGTLLISLAFVRWDGLHLGDVGAWPDGRSLFRFACGFCIGLLLILLTSAILGIFGHVNWVRTEAVNFGEASLALVGYVALSCREELTFHGYPLRRLESLFGSWVALSGTTIIFIVEHVAGGMTWSSAIAGAGMGALLFGMAAIATRGLAVPIGVHAAWNFGDWMRSGGGKTANGFWKAAVDDGFEHSAEIVGWFAYVAVMLLATVVFWFWHRSVRSRG